MNILTHRFYRGSNLVTRCIAGETLLVPVRDQAADLDAIYALNEVGSRIWELLDGQTSVCQIVEVICQSYDVPSAEAVQDVVEFLSSLEEADLIYPAVPGGS